MEEVGGNKSGGVPNWAKVTGTCLLWLTLGSMLFGATAYLDLDQNFFDWSPDLEAETLLASGVALLAVGGSWPLARVSNHLASRLIAWLVVVALLGFGLYLLPAETLSPDTLLGRDHASPLWYRGGRALVLALPALFLVLRKLRVGSVTPDSTS